MGCSVGSCLRGCSTAVAGLEVGLVGFWAKFCASDAKTWLCATRVTLSCEHCACQQTPLHVGQWAPPCAGGGILGCCLLNPHIRGRRLRGLLDSAANNIGVLT